MGLDITFFTGNPSTMTAKVYGSYRNLWWVPDFFKIYDDYNGSNFEISKESLSDFIENLSNGNLRDSRKSEEILECVQKIEKEIKWDCEIPYINCWW